GAGQKLAKAHDVCIGGFVHTPEADNELLVEIAQVRDGTDKRRTPKTEVDKEDGPRGYEGSAIAAHGARFAHVGDRRDRKTASSDTEPPPTRTRNNRASSMLTSVRASCKVPQNPFLVNPRILVEYKATAISMRSGTVASRVRKPINNRVPHTISTTPTNGAMTCGHGMPIFTKRPTPKE